LFVISAYLAGPDVFLPDAMAHAGRKVAICARYGMEACDCVIANLTPFRGASADAGTLVELGWFLGRGRPVFGYSNAATPFAERSRVQVAAVPDAMPGLAVEGFGLPDNLMIPGAVLQGGGEGMVLPEDGRDRAFDALDVFERCAALAAAQLGCLPVTPRTGRP
jgi:nucleoside 2-deoxyribosyltransferase